MLGCFQLGKPSYLNSKENSLTKSKGRVDSSGSTTLSRTWAHFLAFHGKIGSPYGCSMTGNSNTCFLIH